MIPKTAIELAIKGGYDARWDNDVEIFFSVRRSGSEPHLLKTLTEEVVALDPSFWQALGKELGWSDSFDNVYRGESMNSEGTWETREVHITEKVANHYAHRFYDKILQGEDTTEFWNEILK